MEILGIGVLELVFIGLIMLIILGPGQLEKTMRMAGSFIRQLRQSAFYKDIMRTEQLKQQVIQQVGLNKVNEEFRSLNDWQLSQKGLENQIGGGQLVQANPKTPNNQPGFPAWSSNQARIRPLHAATTRQDARFPGWIDPNPNTRRGPQRNPISKAGSEIQPVEKNPPTG